MHLKELHLYNFKNIATAEMEFSGGINCFIGNNAAGKTNILDAVYYLSFCKSYFNAIDTQNIRHEEDSFSVTGKYVVNGGKTDLLQCVQKRGAKKSFRLNKKEYDRLADHIGRYPLVMISPYDRDLINEGSDVRRKFIDSIIAQFDRRYLEQLIDYNKALNQRNALLKSFAERRSYDADSLNIWNARLAALTDHIYPERQKFLEAYIPVFKKYFNLISGGNEPVNITYESQLEKQPMEALLESSLEKDLALRYTTQGVHKDDLIFTIMDYPVKKFGSQGQQKSFIIALRLAQYEYIQQIKTFRPVLLLDDIFDKLDENRVEQIIRLAVDNSFGQVFITDTHRDRIEHLLENVNTDHKIYAVNRGTVTEIKNHSKTAQ
jgi:DNA replication and repair protein RecF